MSAPPPDPVKGDRLQPSRETIERERIEEMTLAIREDSPGKKPGASEKGKLREYRTRAVLSYHRFLGRWTAP